MKTKKTFKCISPKDREFVVNLSLRDLCNICVALKASAFFVHHSSILDRYGLDDLRDSADYIQKYLNKANKYFDIMNSSNDNSSEMTF